ncbi:PHP domain-containing protein [Parabacteroides sp. ZJ-118]|uniref:PHP domain-containing protein n=1 Tax=Parabacteroides sp. ZJ-118 TaxID=2709398 RepID=UPI0013EA55FD|nr:PHP domain-containing protein [Parabacteroides sp. ZJ-118]
MNINKKKVLYKFIDLQRASSFLMEKQLVRLADSMVNKISSIDDANIDNSTSRLQIFNDEESCLINEYFMKGTITVVDDCVARLPPWLWLIIKPVFIDVEDLRKDIIEYGIHSKEELCNFYKSNASENKYGKDKSSLYLYFATNQDGSNFPIKYRIFPNEYSPIFNKLNGALIQGNFHNHSLYSDGMYSMEELKDFAMKANRSYIGISDHSHYVGGVSSEQLTRQAHEIDLLNRKGGSFLLKGIECEILKDGSLDMDAFTLSILDYVIVACHRHELMTKKEATDRIIRAVENEHSNILAHPLARIYQKKVGMYLDIHKVIDACIANNVAIEINGDPDRLDLPPEYIRYAINHGAMFTIDSDTHKGQSFKNINNAIRIGEDYLIPSEQILNTKLLNELERFFKK